MDGVMCLLPFAVCFVGFLAAAKVTKKKKRILAAAGVVLFLAAAFGSLAVYRNQKITKPIRDSELLAVAELRLDAFLGDAELNDFQTDRLTELYGALGHYLNSLVYLPCINQDTFDAGTQDVILQFGTEEEVKLWAGVLSRPPDLPREREKGLCFSRWNGRLPEDRSDPGLGQRTDHCDHHGTGCGKRPADGFGCRGKRVCDPRHLRKAADAGRRAGGRQGAFGRRYADRAFGWRGSAECPQSVCAYL